MATTARVASSGAAFTTPAPASSTTTAAATAAAASAATATTTLIAALTPIVRRILVLFTPLPVLPRIPIAILLVRARRRAGGLTRLGTRRLLVPGFLSSAIFTPMPFAAVFFAPVFFAPVFLRAVFLGAVFLVAARRFFGLFVVQLVGRGFANRFGITRGAERGFEIEVGPKVVVGRRRRTLFLWRTRRTAISARRLGSTAFRATRLSTRFTALTLTTAALATRTGRAGFGRRGCRFGLRGRRG